MIADEIIRVEVIGPQGDEGTGELLLWDEDPENKHSVKLSLQFNNRNLESSSSNYFDALKEIRRELEKDGLLLNCYGSCKNVHPSAMSLNMGTGDMAYKLEMGRRATQINLVSIFECDDSVVPVTVDEQEKFYVQWLSSIK